jgi:Cellulase (glycosyl hydrolase family 5)
MSAYRMYKNNWISLSIFLVLSGIIFSILLTTTNAKQASAQENNNTNNKNNNNNTSIHSEYTGFSMRGYYTSSLVENRNFGNTTLPKDYYDDSFKAISQAGMNLVRYLYLWEGYVKNPSAFMNEINTVAQTADKYGVKVIYTNDQYHTSSWLEPEAGYGFPSFLFKSDAKTYPKGSGGGPSSSTDKLWWANWLNRDIKDANGNDGWTLQADFMKKIVNAVNNHTSTLGYEIINEPHVYSIDSWQKVGNYNSFITDQLRTLTQKIIVFDRQVPPDLWGPIGITPENMAKMAPKNKTNVVFKATLFGIPFQNSFAEDRLTVYTKTAQLAGVPLYMGEFNLKVSENYRPVDDVNQTIVNLFVQKFNEVNVWGWGMWIWDFKPHERPFTNYDFATFTKNGLHPNKYFQYIKNAVSNYTKNLHPEPLGIDGQKKANDTIFPTVHITDVSLEQPQGSSDNKKTLVVEGQSIDVGTGIKTVQVHLGKEPYVTAITQKQADWLHWTARLPYKSGNNGSQDQKLVAAAIDNASHITYDTLMVNFP